AVRATSTRERRGARFVYRAAGPALLGAMDAWLTMDHADHRAAGRAARSGGTLSVDVSPQLRCRGRRDCRAAMGARSSVACDCLYGSQRCRAGDPPAGRDSCARGLSPAQDGGSAMSAWLSEESDSDSHAATWLGFMLMCLGMFMAILDIQVVATSLPTIQHA